MAYRNLNKINSEQVATRKNKNDAHYYYGKIKIMGHAKWQFRKLKLMPNGN